MTLTNVTLEIHMVLPLHPAPTDQKGARTDSTHSSIVKFETADNLPVIEAASGRRILRHVEGEAALHFVDIFENKIPWFALSIYLIMEQIK